MEVWEWQEVLSEVLVWSGVVRRPSRRSGSGRESLLEVRQWSGSHTGGPAVFGRPYLRSGSVREALQEVREWSGGPPGGPRVVR